MAGLLSALYSLENLEKSFVFTKWENFWMRGAQGDVPLDAGMTAMLMAGQMHPPLSSSQSPLSSVSACGENCARSLAPPLPTARGAAGAPLGLAKRETGRARSKEKKRYGGSVCASAALLPPAGDGWRSLAVVRDGNALPLG